ncbi:hypothetical protein G4V62_12515 [Bacillaceae bacterium SIJ1]|uniref:hypothetical protein n=1 Tax=Litoribacterium kuwaitense TaxID=1398745 RepID=UPI0013EC8070|nr:hypothetical protein [Litoribacterium kuwaitense]NGP45738.1 hypothetical protein [Litoribacterium kuwaitense]
MSKRKTTAATFSKQQFLQSAQSSGVEKDVLAVVLKDDTTYTKAEAKRLADHFKRKVL